MFFCCYKCIPPKRFPGCHARCKEYLKEKQIYEERKKEVDQKRNLENGLVEHEIKFRVKAHKKNRKIR